MSTTNLELDLITMEDKISSDMPNKINANMQKLDAKYGELKNALQQQTGKNTLVEAINYVQTLANQIAELNATGNAMASDILYGKIAVVKGQVVTGTIPSQPAQTITPGTTNKTIGLSHY